VFNNNSNTLEGCAGCPSVSYKGWKISKDNCKTYNENPSAWAAYNDAKL
jgi:hypothetical protein